MTSGHGTGSREAAVSVDSEGWNVFVSYACEDREEVGRSLAEILKAGHANAVSSDRAQDRGQPL